MYAAEQPSARTGSRCAVIGTTRSAGTAGSATRHRAPDDSIGGAKILRKTPGRVWYAVCTAIRWAAPLK